MRSLFPISRQFGFDRGQPIDRYYIESFLRKHSDTIHGHVLEIGDDKYTREFGARVARSDVLDVAGGRHATIVADLATAKDIASDSFDCIILTQTLQFIYDFKAAIRTLYRILRPQGVLLGTFPGISQISRYDMERWGEYWRFTTLSTLRLFEEVFSPENIQVQSHGNVLAAVAFLHGLAAEELSKQELDYHDPDYELLITLKAQKPREPDQVR